MEALGRTIENPDDPLGVDVARIGLGAPPKPSLDGSTPRPSGAGLDGGECYFLFLVFLFLHYFYIWSLLILFAIPGAFDNIISGWADVLEAIYKDIGGCSSYIPYRITFCLTFLTCKFAARPPSPSEERGLLQVTADELGVAMHGMLLFSFSSLLLYCACG